MPITPFHIGPGVLCKAAAPRAVSLTAFTAANVVIDVESVVNIMAGRAPVHATLHTFAVGLAVGLVVGALVAWLGKRWRPNWTDLKPVPALVGGLLGGLSQPLLDAIMHADMRPFLPFTDANPLLGLVDLGVLHLACVLSGMVGLAWLGWTMK